MGCACTPAKRAADTLGELVESALKEVQLWNDVRDSLHKPATRLTLEQQQKLCIARLLPLKPRVILMDEPCSALDAEGTAAIERLMDGLREKYTIVIVTHNMAQARRVSDECIFMLLGKSSSTGGRPTCSSGRRRKRPSSTWKAATARGHRHMQRLAEELDTSEGAPHRDGRRRRVDGGLGREPRSWRGIPRVIRRVEDGEPTVDQFQIEIDSEAIRLMTVYTPIARDLRFLLMVARINSELERIGDQSLNNCEYIQQLPPNPRPRAFERPLPDGGDHAGHGPRCAAHIQRRGRRSRADRWSTPTMRSMPCMCRRFAISSAGAPTRTS